jgi:hypothetical protein
MTKKKILYLVVFCFTFVVFSVFKPETECIQAQNKTEGNEDTVSVKKPENKEYNQRCFKCHGKTIYEAMSPDSSKILKLRMYSNCIISEKMFYSSNHLSFKCTDCHSEDYTTFPHKGELRFEEKPNCIDCHGGDPKYEQFQFEKINDEFLKSVHSTKHSATFNCWMCHDPHSYKTNAGTQQEIVKTVAYDNSMCLSCHADVTKYQLISDNENPNVLKTHEWLPNQKNHFKKVRCIECHAHINDSIIVAHNIQPKEKAVKKCIQCHSSNSLLTQTLYKYQSNEKLSNQGFLNAIIMNEGYVVGANRNPILSIACGIILLLALLGILVHGTLRIITKKKN